MAEENQAMEQNTMDINRIPNGAPVNVKLSKMVDGVFYIFAGVMEILRSLDPSEAKKFVSEFANAPDSPNAADDASELANRVNNKTTQTTAPPAADTSAVQTAEKQTEPTPAQASTPASEPSVPSLTVDDITRIVVQKMKQNPGINDKIRALVNAHGAEKVTELASSEYEAFLTDLSQL